MGQLEPDPNTVETAQSEVDNAQPTVTTRSFETADVRALYAIEEACFPPSVRFSRSLMRALAFDPGCRTWLGIIDNVRVGFAILGLQSDHDPAATYIWTIEVLPAFRRRGVARALLLRAEESAHEAGFIAVELHVSERNADGLALYEAAGYTKVGVETEYYGLREDAFRYRKTL